MTREFTDAQLQQVAEHVARRYLEVERGLRPRQHLRRYLSPQAYDRQYDQAASRFGTGGIVRQSDLGPVVFQRPAPDHAHVVVPARQEGDRWGALVMELRADQRGVWRVTELTRAQDRNLARPQPGWAPATVPDRDTALDRLTMDAEAAALARHVAAERHVRAQDTLARLAPEKPASDLQPGDLVNIGAPADPQWVKVRQVALGPANVTVRAADGRALHIPAERPVPVLKVAAGDLQATRTAAQQAAQELASRAHEVARWDRELRHLDEQRDALQPTPPGDHRLLDWDSRVDPPAYLTGMLGNPPQHAEARALWHAAADIIQAYRQRWAITTTGSALGPRPADDTQRADRDQTVALLRELTARRRSLDHQPTDVGSPDRAARSANRDPFATQPAGRT